MRGPLRIEIPETHLVRVDYSPGDRQLMTLFPRLTAADQTVEIERAILDTGASSSIVAPRAEIARLFGQDWAELVDARPGEPIVGFGGRVATDRFQATLQLAHWTLTDCEVFVPEEGADHVRNWLIGLPVLRHFHLILNDREHIGAPWLAGPRALLPLPGQWLPAR